MPDSQTIVIAVAAIVLVWLFRELVVEKLQTRLAMVVLGFGGVGFYAGYSVLPGFTLSLPSVSGSPPTLTA
ncbi:MULTISPECIES: hypothetical protein [Haloferax]|nr:hypothetical protein [Haloferax mediterranei]MDX5987063.1 hypothetical protein [Haloferax mediterranei ATCC 33500]